MKQKYSDSISPSVLLVTLMLTASPSLASTFTVTTDTSALIGQPSGPFLLDFQFIDGSGFGDANNTVTLSGFNFNGGSWFGAPTIAGGASAGPGSITLTDSAFFNELFRGFTAGFTLSFEVSITGVIDPDIPDQFSFAILDNTLSEIPTLGLGDAFLSLDIDFNNPTVQTFRSDLTRTTINIAPSVTFASVPETRLPFGIAACVWAAGFLIRCPSNRGRI